MNKHEVNREAIKLILYQLSLAKFDALRMLKLNFSNDDAEMIFEEYKEIIWNGVLNTIKNGG